MSTATKTPPAKQRAKGWVKPTILGLLLLLLVVVGVAAAPHLIDFLSAEEKPDKTLPERGSARLFRDAQGRRGIEVSADVTASLLVTTVQVQNVEKEKALPTMLGQTAYDIDYLYVVRSIGNGKLIKFTQMIDAIGSIEAKEPKYRQIGFGDRVEKDQLLAIVRSPDLAQKKADYVDSLLDLGIDRERQQKMEELFKKGSINESAYRDAVYKVQKDVQAMFRTKRVLELIPLKPQEIKALEVEARTIQARFRELSKADISVKESQWHRDKVEEWARVEITAPEAGMIVEKNVNVGDIVDPGKDPPLFKIANLKHLSVWIHPSEEYLPVLQKLLKDNAPEKIRLKLEVQSASRPKVLRGWLLRFAPSLDPNMRTPLLLGRIDNAEGTNLLVGQLLKATIYVPSHTGLVTIPTNALNEVNGQALVLVQERGFFHGRNRYALRRVLVAHQFQDTVQVRSELDLSEEEKTRLAAEVKRGLLPIEPLKPGEWVVTGGVVELTDAIEDLKTKEKPPKKDKASGAT